MVNEINESFSYSIFTYFIRTYLGKCWIQVIINLVYSKFYSFVNILIIMANRRNKTNRRGRGRTQRRTQRRSRGQRGGWTYQVLDDL